jgi:hypothetical protein
MAVAWDCLMNRKDYMKPRFAGDLSYILMGLLRLKPAVDITDSPFQAFGRYAASRATTHVALRFRANVATDYRCPRIVIGSWRG